MDIAYLILCHTDPKHIKRLAEKITKNTNDVAFIHVDKKCDIELFKQELQNNSRIQLIKNRVLVHWGGYSSIEATINLFRTAMSCDGHKFQRFVILQGLEYPIKTNQEIHNFFDKNLEEEFILAQNISESNDPKVKYKYSLYWNLDSASSLGTKFVHKLNSILFIKTGIVPAFKSNYVKSSDGVKMQIYQGCAQFSITRRLVEYIVKFHDKNNQFNQYFKTVYASDESYFHTIVYNSPFIKSTPYGKAVKRQLLTDFENLTYFEYKNGVKVLTEKSEWPKLKDSGYLFFRKASSESKELLDYIDKQHELIETRKIQSNY